MKILILLYSRLSISRIVDTIDPGITNVFKEYIESDIWTQLERDEEDDLLDNLLDPNDRSFITSFCSSLTLVCFKVAYYIWASLTHSICYIDRLDPPWVKTT